MFDHSPRLRWVIAGGGLAATLGLGLALPAYADATYHVANTQGLTLTVRSAPSLIANPVSQLQPGQQITITCQTTGDDVNNTSAIWDQLPTGGYVSDYYTDTPNIGTYSPGIPQCTGAPAPSPIDGAQAEAAISWFQQRFGDTSYEGWCEAAVDDAYGAHRYATALDGWYDAVARGVAHPGDQDPPRGALVYWNIPDYPNGHVGVALGGGGFVATSVNNAIGTAHLPYYSGYLGWAPPIFG